MNIATFGPDGNIHLVAMWYGFLGDNPAFETFTKSQKIQNLRRDPRMTALVEDGETYESLRGVEIVGTAVLHEDPEVVTAVARSVAERYIEVDSPEALDAAAAAMAVKRVAVEIVAEKVVSWDHGKLAGDY